MVWAYVPTFNLDPETPKSLVEFYYISWEKLEPEKIFFFMYFFFILFYHFFCDFSHVFGCMVWA